MTSAPPAQVNACSIERTANGGYLVRVGAADGSLGTPRLPRESVLAFASVTALCSWVRREMGPPPRPKAKPKPKPPKPEPLPEAKPPEAPPTA